MKNNLMNENETNINGPYLFFVTDNGCEHLPFAPVQTLVCINPLSYWQKENKQYNKNIIKYLIEQDSFPMSLKPYIDDWAWIEKFETTFIIHEKKVAEVRSELLKKGFIEDASFTKFMFRTYV